jgi:hypothetical protein
VACESADIPVEPGYPLEDGCLTEALGAR